MRRRNWYKVARYAAVAAWAAWAACVAAYLCTWAASSGGEVQTPDSGRLPGDDVPATERCYMTEEEIRVAMLDGMTRLEDVKITHYCTELRPHICGTGDGITASGRPVEAYVSAAVDPAVIPLGSTLLIDYGDGVLHEYRADDIGGGVDGLHVDIAVTSHQEALELGVKTATVYFSEPREGER